MCTRLTKKILESESMTNPDSFVHSPSDQVHACKKVTDKEQEATIDEQMEITTAQQQDEEPGPSGWTGNVRKTASDDSVSREESLDQLINIMGVEEQETETSESIPCTQKQTKQRQSYSRKGKGKGKGKRKGKRGRKGKGSASIEEDNSEKCVVCNGIDTGGEDWINCDMCTEWYHRKYTNITDNEWHMYTLENDSSPFICPLCE